MMAILVGLESPRIQVNVDDFTWYKRCPSLGDPWRSIRVEAGVDVSASLKMCSHQMVLRRIPKPKPKGCREVAKNLLKYPFWLVHSHFLLITSTIFFQKINFCCLTPTTRMAPVAILHISHRLWSELHRWWCYLHRWLCEAAHGTGNPATVPFWLVFDFFTGDKQ